MILHSTRSERFSIHEEYQKTINYMMLPETVSSHYVVGFDLGQVAQMVDLDYMAWHAEEDNEYYLGIEFTQPLPTDSYSQWQVDCGRTLLGQLASSYSFPLDRLHILRHQDTLQGKRWGKSDPGDLLDIDYMLRQ